MSESLPDGPAVQRRPLPGVPPLGTRPVSMPLGKPPSAPPRSESMEKWQPMKTSGSDSKQNRSRPVIQVLDARPMSEVGFRGDENVAANVSPRNDEPDITQTSRQNTQERPDVSRRPPLPARPPSFRHSMVNENNQKNQEAEDSGNIYKSKPLPPKPVSRASRPMSMLSRLPNSLTVGQRKTEPNNRIHDQVTGIDNGGFDSRRDHNMESSGDSSRNHTNVPDLLTGDTEGMYKRDIDLLSDVPDDIQRHSEPMEEPGRHKGIPVFPPGVLVKARPSSRGQPPPLPKKSPSVQNLSTISGEATLGSLCNDEKGDALDGGDNDDEGYNTTRTSPPNPVPKLPRGPTIIRPGSRVMISNVHSEPDHSSDIGPDGDNDNKNKSSNAEESTVNTSTTERKLPPGVAGGVRIFPFAVPKSASDHGSLKPSALSEGSSSTTKPVPALKPKPALLAKPALKPKPNLAPKPIRRPQSAMFPSHEITQRDESSGQSKSKAEGMVLPAKAPWQNELNARLGLKKASSEKKDVDYTEVKKEEATGQSTQVQDEWDTDELKEAASSDSRKPGPLKATYRPTIIRAVAPKQHKEEDIVVASSRSRPDVINKRFSSSCVDMRSTGDLDLKPWNGNSQGQTVGIEENNNTPPVSKDDSYKSSSDVVMRRRQGPTIIRPPSMVNLNRPSAEDDAEKPVTQESWRSSALIQESSSYNRQSHRQSEVEKSKPPPGRPRPPSPVSQRRRSSSMVSGEAVKFALISPPPQKKSPPGKAPPPRPVSGPRRDPQRRQTARFDKHSPSRATSRRASTGGSDISSPTSPSYPHGVALFDFTATQPDELSFQKGDTLELIRSDNPEWMYGRLGRSEGLFPVNFIHVVIPPPSGERTNSPPQKMPPTDPHCIALHDYNSGEPSDLVFYTDDVITLLERVDADWLKGECQGRQGMFPVTFVSIVKDLPEKGPSTVASVSKLQIHAEPPANTTVKKGLGYCVATHDFPAQQDGDLPFSQDDRITLLEKIDSDWWRGEFNGKEGIFPASFVQMEMGSAVVEDQPPPLPSSPPPGGPPGLSPSLAVVLFSFPGESEGDLPLDVGQEVEVLDRLDGGEWMRGRVEGREGIFPAAFVEIFS